jgi:signal transduction histidine kinase
VSRDRVVEIGGRDRPFYVNTLRRTTTGQVLAGVDASPGSSGIYDVSDPLAPRALGGGTGTVTSFAPSGRWAGSLGQGVFRLAPGTVGERITLASSGGGLRSDTVYAILEDREGVVWFGTDRGACRFDPNSPWVARVAEEPDALFTRSLLRGAHGTLCGTNAGLFVERAGTWGRVPEIGERAVYALAEVAGRVYAGTSAGLFVGDPGGPFRLIGAPLSSVRAIAGFRGIVYIARFGTGVERVEETDTVPVWPPPDGEPKTRDVVSLFADADRALWVGTAEAGLYAFEGSTARRVSGGPAFDSGAVWAVARHRGAVWAGSSAGLYREVGDRFERVVADTSVRCLGVPDEQVVAGSDGLGAVIRCGTESDGVLAVRLEEDGVLVSRLDTEHGLPAHGVFAISLDPDASFLAGTGSGIAAYTPSHVPPGLAVASVVGGRAYTAEETAAGFELDYPQRDLIAELTPTSTRTFPEQFQYRYVLRGPGGRVVASDTVRAPRIALAGLGPGTYELTARAFSADLVPSEPVVLRFAVARAPFPWTTLWLSLLLGAALLALAWGLMQNRRLTRSNTLLASTRAKLVDETERERRRIARDLHDQTLADLRRLMLLSDSLPEPVPGSSVSPSTFRQEIESISTEIRRICEDLSPSVLGNIGLPAALEWAMTSAAAYLPASRRFAYEVRADPALDEARALSPEREIQVYRIVQEAVSNVGRHAGARCVRLEASLANGRLYVRLEDDGTRFDRGPRRAPAAASTTSSRGRA